jgi:histidinol phosphatase-like PHP family hydrolase
MQFYKYETHSHTSLVSECSTITPEILARYYKAHGYAGVFITDHFLNGNTPYLRNYHGKIKFINFARVMKEH